MSKDKNKVAVAKYYAEIKYVKQMASDSSTRIEVDLGETSYETPSALFNMKRDPEQCHMIMCDEHTFLRIMKMLLAQDDTEVMISDGDLNALQNKLILTGEPNDTAEEMEL